MSEYCQCPKAGYGGCHKSHPVHFLGRSCRDRGQRWCCQYCQVEQAWLIVNVVNCANICNIASIVNIANIVKFQILPILCSNKTVNRLSSGEKLGVLSQGPTIVYDVKMVGLKVNLEMQDIEIH